MARIRDKPLYLYRWSTITIKAGKVTDFTRIRVKCKFVLVGRWWIAGFSLSRRCGSEFVATSAQMENSKLLELARKQRMNTDVRKNVFLVMMTSEVNKLEPLLSCLLVKKFRKASVICK